MITRRTLAGTATALALGGRARAQQRTRPIRIGVLTDMSGPFSDDNGPGSVVAAQMAAADAGGKVGNLPIEVMSADMQNKVDLSTSIAREWLDAQNVDVIMDVPFSPAMLAVSEIVRDKNGILVTTAGTSVTGPRCSANTVQWAFNLYSNVSVVVQSLSAAGAKTWFFITADYVFGQEIESLGRRFVAEAGGKVIGSVKHPAGVVDQSSAVVQAISSGADVIALANGGTDTQNTVKQLAEFGVIGGDKQRVTFFASGHAAITAMGLSKTQGVFVPYPWYAYLNEPSRAWTSRFMAASGGRLPHFQHASTYAFLTHYFKNMKADPSLRGAAALDAMRRQRTDDPLFGAGELRVNGSHVHPYYLLQVRKEGEVKEKYDIFNLVRTIPGEQAFQPLAESGCPLVKQAG